MSNRDDIRSALDDTQFALWRAFFRIVIPVLIVSGLFGLAHWVFSVPAGVVQRVVNPDAIVLHYEYYESQFQDIQAADAQIKTAVLAVARFKEEAGPRAQWTFDMREELARLNDNLDGLRFYRSKLIADYNAKSRMVTRTLWKRSDLPYHIDD
jgi:hypothetical protein